MVTDSKDHHFLVVDDDPDARGVLVEYLQKMGFQKVSAARDGAEAIRLIDRDPSISFIISDWDMPLMNGLTLLQQIRSKPKLAHIPFLIVTSPIAREAEKVVLAAENMVDGYMIKPFRAQAFQEKIQKVLELTVHGVQKRVLIVDDSAEARDMVIEYVKKLGFKDIHGIEDGQAALEYLNDHGTEIGLIISDWEMPKLTGIELLRACKANPVLAEIPFLMVTSQTSMERMKVMQAAQAQVDQYLLKPFTSGDLKSRIVEMLDKFRNRAKIMTLYLEARSHLENGRFQPSIRVFEQILLLDPDHENGLIGMAEAVSKIKGMEAALPYLKRAVSAHPMSLQAYLTLAMAYEKLNEVDQAIALIQSATKNLSFNAELHFYLGSLYRANKMVAEAVTEFEKVLSIQPNHQEAKLLLETLKSKG